MPQPSAVPYWNMIKDSSREVKETLLNMLYISLSTEDSNVADVSGKSCADYNLEELLMRSDEAYMELESGGGMDGEKFFENIRQNVISR